MAGMRRTSSTPAHVAAIASGNNTKDVSNVSRVNRPSAMKGGTFTQFTTAKKSNIVPMNTSRGSRCGMT